MKKFFKLLILTISILIVSVPVFATDVLMGTYDTSILNGSYSGYSNYDTTIANGLNLNTIKVQKDGKFIDFTDSEGNIVEPQIINSRTMVPMRKIFEEFGAEVEWIPETRSIIAKTNDKEIGLQIDNPNATVKNSNGEVTNITLDSVPVIVENRTLVPVRFIAESLEKVVGWDVKNKSVVIVDPSLVEEEIKNNASNFHEYLTTDFEIVTTSVTETEITGKVNYEDKENDDNNSLLNIAGDAQISTSEVAMQIDLDLAITGKGVLMTKVEEEGLEDIELTIIVDIENGFMYMSSNTYEGEMKGKWARYEFDDSDKALLKASASQNTNMESLIASLIQEENLVLGSYEELAMSVNMITSLMSNDNFKSSGRTTKTYEYEIELVDLLESLGYAEEEIKEIDNIYDFEMKSEIKVSDKITEQSNTTINFGVEYEAEVVDATLEAETVLKSYNEKVDIKIPTENIVEVEIEE